MASTNIDDISFKSPNPTTSLIFFIAITTIFSVAKNFITKISKDPAPPNVKCENIDVKDTAGSITLTCAYVLLLVIGNYFINLNVTTAVCGEVQWTNTFFTTLVPWLIIFGIMNLLLTIYPAWLSPFSNTIGYLVAKLFGLEATLENILKSNFVKGEISNREQKNIGEALQHIYSDKSLIINEITEDNFCTFWKNMSGAGLFNKEGNTLENRIELYNFIKLKDDVAQYIWFILTGCLVTSVGYNYIINSECNRSVKSMEKRHNDYIDKQEQIHEENKKNKPRIYTYE